MVKYYHGTHCKRAKGIKKYGLGAGGEAVHIESRGRCPAVYITDNVDSAKWYAYDASKNAPAEYIEYADADLKNVCVVTIKCLAKGEKAVPDGFGDLMTFKPIPPKCIGKILYPKDLKKMGEWEWD